MIRTPFTQLFDLEVPVVQAPIWPAVSPELVAAVGEAGAIGSGDPHELVPFTGQTAGLIHETLPAGEIVERIVTESERAAARLGAAMGETG